MDVKVRRHTNQKCTPCNIHTSFIPIEKDLRAGSQPSGTGGLPASPPLQQVNSTSPGLASWAHSFRPGCAPVGTVCIRSNCSSIQIMDSYSRQGIGPGLPRSVHCIGSPTPLTVMSLHILQRPTLLPPSREGALCCAVRARATVHFGGLHLCLRTSPSPTSQQPQVQDESTRAAIPISPQPMLHSTNRLTSLPGEAPCFSKLSLVQSQQTNRQTITAHRRRTF